MNQIIKKIREELKANIDEHTKASSQRFFKEKIKCYGVRSGTVNKIARKYWAEVRALEKKDIFDICEEMYRSDHCEESFMASWWLPRLSGQFKRSDLKIFKRWISEYVNNWAKCDTFCNHTLGNYLEIYPQDAEELKKWTASNNRWLKRAAAVSFIVPAKKGKFLQDAFEISDLLISDKDDMVQKGYGWLLKEESRTRQKEVFDYVMKNKKTMPRTALRYAIELMPKELKARAMARE
ncbi:MAG: DNA alkylation repair protein [Candidatus Paceibacterota bacterium]|jgi:3-methyladenine DNA glycosylase AlkD